ncbi:MAG: HAMP domain-containing protein [Treponema sp.]|jgi:adenylate cyclase|nr:HAMP domain-containing protein [Treponema sp.]
MSKTTESAGRKVIFSLGGKLVIIITSLLFLSMMAITVLVWVLVSAEVGRTAEATDLMVNQRSVAEVETLLKTVKSDTLTLLNTLKLFGQEDAIQGASAFFFEQNQDIAALVLPRGLVITNEHFFLSKEVEPELIPTFIATLGATLPRVAPGEDLLLNGTPVFGIPMLVMLYPEETGETVLVFFSVQRTTENFGAGANDSFMINDTGALLIHPDQELVQSGASMEQDTLVQTALKSGDLSFQTHYTDEAGVQYFGAFQKLAHAIVITRIQRDVVFEGIIATTRRNIYLTITVLFLSILFIWFFSKTISSPLKVLTWVAGQIDTGNYHLDLTSKSRDETGILTRSFISMSHGLENFEKFTNQGIVKLARQGKLSLGGVSKNATVCFALIRDFSEIAEGFHAQEVVRFINEYMYRMVPCITRTLGVVDKFLTQGGVVVMALWGTVESAGSPELDALNCLKAVLMMRASLRSLNLEQGRSGKSLIKMGCGINSGEVVSGQMGSEERMEFTVIGETVNLAARIEGPNDLFDTDILITENVYKLIGQHLLIEEMPNIEVKGKVEPLKVFSVVNMRDATQATQILKDLERIPKTSPVINRRCVGPHGPRSMAEVRERW